MSQKGLPGGTRYTAEMFLVDTGRYRNARVLTTEEVSERKGTVVSHVFVGEDQNVMFYSDNHMFGYPILPSQCVPCTVTIPRSIAPRPTFEDGWIMNAADEVRFNQYCNPKLRVLQSMEELVEYLNRSL